MVCGKDTSKGMSTKRANRDEEGSDDDEEEEARPRKLLRARASVVKGGVEVCL